MKRVLLVFALVSAVACGSAFAQLSVGGALGFNYKGESSTTKAGGTTVNADGASQFTFKFLPYAIYSLNSDFGVGAHVGATYTSNTEPNPGIGDEHKNDRTVTSNLVFEFTPFVRYSLLGNDRISVFLDGRVPLKFGSVGAAKVVNGNNTTNVDGASLMSFGIAVVPGLKVNLTSNLALVATADIASLNFNYQAVTQTVGSASATKSTTGFSLGLGSTPFTIGVSRSF